MSGKPTVVLHVDVDGNVVVYADGAVDVIYAYDLTPDDRLYRCNPEPIPAGLLDGPIGAAGDGSPAEARITRAVRDAFGMPAFDVYEGGRCDE